MRASGVLVQSRRCFGLLTASAFCSCKSFGLHRGSLLGLCSKLRELLEARSFHGTMLVTRGDSTLFAASRAHVGSKTSHLLKMGDRFVIGSISKQITAAIVLRAYEQRLLALDDPIGVYLPEIRQSWSQRVTVHHLLTHTHGIQDLDQPLAFELGKRFEYSQLGYALLAQVVEAVSKESFDQLCRKLFAQLDLGSTYHPQDHKQAEFFHGLERKAGTKYRIATESLRNYAAAGSMISTASDLARWNKLLHSGKIVSNDSLALMSTRYATRQHPIFGEVEYGYGLLFDKHERELQIGALGYAPGFASASYYYPQKKMSLVVLSNRVDLSQGFPNAFRVHTEAMRLVKEQQG